jgi:CxxC motif-containing protein
MKTEQSELICTTCPKGCTLVISKDGETIVDVKAGCKRGKDYAHQELTDPRRMVASTVRIEGARHPLLPVYTAAPFPKPRIPELVSVLRQVTVQAPVRSGTVVLPDVLGTGIDILASRDM